MRVHRVWRACVIKETYNHPIFWQMPLSGTTCKSTHQINTHTKKKTVRGKQFRHLD